MQANRTVAELELYGELHEYLNSEMQKRHTLERISLNKVEKRKIMLKRCEALEREANGNPARTATIRQYREYLREKIGEIPLPKTDYEILKNRIQTAFERDFASYKKAHPVKAFFNKIFDHNNATVKTEILSRMKQRFRFQDEQVIINATMENLQKLPKVKNKKLCETIDYLIEDYKHKLNTELNKRKVEKCSADGITRLSESQENQIKEQIVYEIINRKNSVNALERAGLSAFLGRNLGADDRKIREIYNRNNVNGNALANTAILTKIFSVAAGATGIVAGVVGAVTAGVALIPISLGLIGASAAGFTAGAVISSKIEAQCGVEPKRLQSLIFAEMKRTGRCIESLSGEIKLDSDLLRGDENVRRLPAMRIPVVEKRVQDNSLLAARKPIVAATSKQKAKKKNGNARQPVKIELKPIKTETQVQRRPIRIKPHISIK